MGQAQESWAILTRGVVMSEQAKSGIRFSAWKYLGAMFMETKNGYLAVSFTRLLGLILFIVCLGIWTTAYFVDPNESGTCVTWDIPDGMLYTLWWLLGIKGVKDFAIGWNRRQNGN